MATSKATYHHGDLRAACVSAAMELLEESGETALSLRAVARRAGYRQPRRTGTTPIPFLHLDGKLDTSTPSAVADRVTAAIHALLSATSNDAHSAHLR